MEFTTTAVPTQTRAVAPNPFHVKVGELAATADPATGISTNAAVFTIPKEGSGPTLRLLSEAGAAHDVSVRKTIVEDGNQITVTFWTVPRITRPRKPVS